MTPIEWLDHTADIGFRVTGSTLEGVFCEAGKALFSLMFIADRIEPSEAYTIEVHADTLEYLLVEWLSELLVQKELTRLIFSRLEVEISGDQSTGWMARGTAFGERLERSKHQPRIEIKGISYLGLAVTCEEEICTAQVIVDV